MSTFYKPLTPDLREKALASIDKSISELLTCQPTAFVGVYLTGYKAARILFEGLPDGYPIPMEDKK